MTARPVLIALCAVLAAGLVACSNDESSSDTTTTSSALLVPGPGPGANPAAIPGVPTDDGRVNAAIDRVDGLAQEAMDRTGIPGMAVAVVHNGEVVFSRGYGVRDTGKPDRVDTDTAFQLASVSKPIGASVIAKEIGDGTVTWDTPLVAHLPSFALADPYVTANVTIADMYAHRSGLPDHAADQLEDIGYDRQQVLDRLRYLPLDPFRAQGQYTNFGLTAAAESVAAAAGTDWATLSEESLYRPLGMAHTSSRFADFEAEPNHAVGHVLVDGKYEAKYVREPDAQAPAGGVSASVTDVATWLAMVMRGGTTADGTRVVDEDALAASLAPAMRAGAGPTQTDARDSFFGYGWEIGDDSSGRVRLTHSGAFYQGAGTTIMAIPNLDLGIVVLTNASGNGTAEALRNDFADLAIFGAVQADWAAGYEKLLTATVSAPVGELVGEQPPANPAPAASNSAYMGTYANDYVGPATVSENGGQLILTIGPKHMQFPLTHWDGSVFTMIPSGENAPDGSIAKVTFEMNGDTASAVELEHFDEDGMGTLGRQP
ncbi:serine hydrolase [Aldersonia sp. NBC_00410]|uniref:serine hydrolase n=1 Tax=Aldersonia sp. NBC_00410 TaxID=2975954 RepID=UPI00225C3E95|nr:serine hydrolase [Aldersonia sp. NBC_00410]MCX5046531.1 serine hydrolase [Aldersonia sp. NBC_00410]